MYYPRLQNSNIKINKIPFATPDSRHLILNSGTDLVVIVVDLMLCRVDFSE